MAMATALPQNVTLRRSVRDFGDMLRRALRAHQAGDLETAERLYREVLDMRAAQPDALHYLGVPRRQQGSSDEGVELIRTALKITPRHPDAHNNLGNIHKERGRLAEAEACYRRALECAPGHHNAQGNLAVVLEVQGRRHRVARGSGMRKWNMAAAFAEGAGHPADGSGRAARRSSLLPGVRRPYSSFPAALAPDAHVATIESRCARRKDP
ncbi:tetratricopeptide repeat protein [Frateuria soli]|uniref:tetratricopeptide repeat protein n=1 Tax=Frateuria soli TaxID=1542730 RepID=UPI001E3857CF|nr:tetratricopeptide repeat protein [Frateuria soli]UGB39151.1 tetratricopeptide repeat protein [Frateuria soli]